MIPHLTLGRDPFARGSLRRVFYWLRGDPRYPLMQPKCCINCGSATRLPGRSAEYPAVFSLYWDDDQGERRSFFLGSLHSGIVSHDPRTYQDGHAVFCSMDCARSYLQ